LVAEGKIMLVTGTCVKRKNSYSIVDP